MVDNATHLEAINSPVRTIGAQVRVYDGYPTSSTPLLGTYTQNDCLISFTVERVGGSGFFGFGICQKLNVKLVDVNREKDFSTSCYIKINFEVDGNIEDSDGHTFAVPFRIHECRRDEVTNELSITAYDLIKDLDNYTFNDLLEYVDYRERESFDLSIIAQHIGEYFLHESGSSIRDIGSGIADLEEFDSYTYDELNLTGNETLRQVMDWIAEVYGVVYFLKSHWAYGLQFCKFRADDTAITTIDKSKYFELSSKTNRRLKRVVSTTSLGDNIEQSIEASGTTQYILNNPFYELRTNRAEMMSAAFTPMLGLTINQFDCTWRGNYLIFIGEKIGLVTKDNNTVYSYLLDDTITYDGTLSQKTAWKYEEPSETATTNPSTIGEAINQTFATVDKVNKQIQLVASELGTQNEEIAQLRLNQDEIAASVKQTETDIDTLEKEVKATITSEQVKIEIESAISKLNTDKVTTTTGYTFDADGLKISKSGSEMSTEITEDGMTVYRGSEAVLIADNEGVKAEDLHATTYLLIGSNSRIEDFGSDRTGCFWIGK